ncbi:MAG: hypothetical protein ACREVA_04805 [Burkholderiales bacterium]
MAVDLLFELAQHVQNLLEGRALSEEHLSLILSVYDVGDDQPDPVGSGGGVNVIRAGNPVLPKDRTTEKQNYVNTEFCV